METRTTSLSKDKGFRKVEEHKHPEAPHNYWHPANRIHTGVQPVHLIGVDKLNMKTFTYVCISCEKPCVQTAYITPFGCLSHFKHKNSQWKLANIG